MANVKIIHRDSTGRITFLVDDKRYIFVVDAGLMRNSKSFKKLMAKAPGEAFNYVKQHGRLIYPKPQPRMSDMPKDVCPSCGAQSYVEDVPCPNCGYPNEGMSFKKWLKW